MSIFIYTFTHVYGLHSLQFVCVSVFLSEFTNWKLKELARGMAEATPTHTIRIRDGNEGGVLRAAAMTSETSEPIWDEQVLREDRISAKAERTSNTVRWQGRHVAEDSVPLRTARGRRGGRGSLWAAGREHRDPPC